MSSPTIKMHHAVLSAGLRPAVKWDLVARAATDNASSSWVARYRATASAAETVRERVARADETHPC